jgi:toxin ParE1/3/4
MKVVWRKKAMDELNAVYKYSKKESPQNAVAVFNTLFDAANSLIYFPYKFPKEPTLANENVRFFVVFSYKIIYAIHQESIVILRVVTTKQHPKKRKKK